MDATRPNDVGRPSHPQDSSQAGNVTTWHYDYESFRGDTPSRIFLLRDAVTLMKSVSPGLDGFL
jgi:hypothetical protein